MRCRLAPLGRTGRLHLYLFKYSLETLQFLPLQTACTDFRPYTSGRVECLPLQVVRGIQGKVRASFSLQIRSALNTMLEDDI